MSQTGKLTQIVSIKDFVNEDGTMMQIPNDEAPDEIPVIFVGKTLKMRNYDIPGSVFKNSFPVKSNGIKTCMERYVDKLFNDVLADYMNRDEFLSMKGARLAVFPSIFNHAEVLAYVLDNNVPFDEDGAAHVKEHFNQIFDEEAEEIIADIDTDRLSTKRGSYSADELKDMVARLSLRNPPKSKKCDLVEILKEHLRDVKEEKSNRLD